jgi:hypothetical protein
MQSMLVAAKAMAMTAAELVAQPELVRAARAEWEAAQG